MRMDSIPPPNVLAALNWVNERGDSAMLPTSHSSSNGGCGNAAKGNMEHYSLHHVFDTTPLSSLYTASLPPSLQAVQGPAERRFRYYYSPKHSSRVKQADFCTMSRCHPPHRRAALITVGWARGLRERKQPLMIFFQQRFWLGRMVHNMGYQVEGVFRTSILFLRYQH